MTRLHEGQYHYTECGLDYIYLENGFEEKERRGETVYSIPNIEELNKAIARIIISSQQPLLGMDVRFIRSMMDLSQTCFAKLLGMTRDNIARMEAKAKRADPVSSSAQRLVRIAYAAYIEEDSMLAHIAHSLADYEEKKIAKELDLIKEDGGWSKFRSAA